MRWLARSCKCACPQQPRGLETLRHAFLCLSTLGLVPVHLVHPLGYRLPSQVFAPVRLPAVSPPLVISRLGSLLTWQRQRAGAARVRDESAAFHRQGDQHLGRLRERDGVFRPGVQEEGRRKDCERPTHHTPHAISLTLAPYYCTPARAVQAFLFFSFLFPSSCFFDNPRT